MIVNAVQNFVGKLYAWYGKKTVWAVCGVIVFLSIAGVTLLLQNSDPAEEAKQLPLVTVSTISEITSQDTITLIGTVRAVNEAQIQSEVAGRVTSVSVSLGETVRAGQILGQQDNASQRAAVLQAEGSYEAALASAQQSDVSVTQAQTNVTAAQNNLIASYKSAYTTTQNILLATIDDFFSSPNSSVPGLYINGFGYTATLNSERVAFQTIMREWQQSSASINTNDNLVAKANQAQQDINRLLAMIDIFISLIDRQDVGTMVAGVSVDTYYDILLADRATLENTRASLQTQTSALSTAQENLAKANLGGTNPAISAANAQVKQALGGLRAAQANLEKTIFRSPIAGTVNSLSIHTGDYISAFTTVAEIANNNALEISTYVGESDLARIAIGDTVRIEGKYDGVVTQIAPGIDSATQKSEIKIATETAELTNGNTVRIALSSEAQESQNTGPVLLPITAIKFHAENGAIFSVENNTLIAHEVTLGQIRGTYIEILSDIDTTMQIVIDARGLSAGGKVEVAK